MTIKSSYANLPLLFKNLRQAKNFKKEGEVIMNERHGNLMTIVGVLTLMFGFLVLCLLTTGESNQEQFYISRNVFYMVMFMITFCGTVLGCLGIIQIIRSGRGEALTDIEVGQYRLLVLSESKDDEMCHLIIQAKHEYPTDKIFDWDDPMYYYLPILGFDGTYREVDPEDNLWLEVSEKNGFKKLRIIEPEENDSADDKFGDQVKQALKKIEADDVQKEKPTITTKDGSVYEQAIADDDPQGRLSQKDLNALKPVIEKADAAAKEQWAKEDAENILQQVEPPPDNDEDDDEMVRIGDTKGFVGGGIQQEDGSMKQIDPNMRIPKFLVESFEELDKQEDDGMVPATDLPNVVAAGDVAVNKDGSKVAVTDPNLKVPKDLFDDEAETPDPLANAKPTPEEEKEFEENMGKIPPIPPADKSQ